MKQVSIMRKMIAAVLSITLCSMGMTVPAFSADDVEELPSKIDLRDFGAVTSVKTQVGGTCDAFSAIAAIESNMIMQGMADQTIDLSEEHLSWFANVQGNPDIRMIRSGTTGRTRALSTSQTGLLTGMLSDF